MAGGGDAPKDDAEVFERCKALRKAEERSGFGGVASVGGLAGDDELRVDDVRGRLRILSMRVRSDLSEVRSEVPSVEGGGTTEEDSVLDRRGMSLSMRKRLDLVSGPLLD